MEDENVFIREVENVREGENKMSENNNLDIKLEMEKIREMYDSDPRSQSYNALIYGGTGSGKTSLLRTCRLPLHLDSFDPGGSKVLQGEAILNDKKYPDEMARGNIMVDARYESEDPDNPTMAEAWDKEFHRRKKMGYFDLLGTYAIDSITTWSQTILYSVMKKAGRKGGQPFQNDWLPQMTIIENAVRQIISLPCDVVFIGHDDSDKDEATGRMFISLMITGKLKRRVPLMFDEVYYAMTKETSKGVEYQLLTKKTGMYQARSRLANKGQLEMYEKADIKNILKKAGRSTEDKPSLFN